MASHELNIQNYFSFKIPEVKTLWNSKTEQFMSKEK